MKPDFSKASPRPWRTNGASHVYSMAKKDGVLITKFNSATVGTLNAFGNAAVAVHAVNNIEAREATIRDLVEALRPFARMADIADHYIEDVCPDVVWPIGKISDGMGPARLDANDFRHARAALARAEKESGDA